MTGLIGKESALSVEEFFKNMYSGFKLLDLNSLFDKKVSDKTLSNDTVVLLLGNWRQVEHTAYSIIPHT